MRFSLWFFLVFAFAPAIKAQHPFYTALNEEAKLAMSSDNADLATVAEKFEIAAFGLYEYPKTLEGIYVHLTLVYIRLKDKDAAALSMDKALKLHHEDATKPGDVSDADWYQFEIASGLRQPPAPPLPKEINKLQDLVLKEPKRLDAWQALLNEQLKQKAYSSKNRRFVDRAVEEFPGNENILASALIYAVSGSRKAESDSYAAKLLKTNTHAELLNEYFGRKQADEKNWAKAAEFFTAVNQSVLPGTAAIQKEVASQLNKLELEKQRKEEEARKDLERKTLERKKQEDLAKKESERKLLEKEVAEKARLEKQQEALEKKESESKARGKKENKASATKVEAKLPNVKPLPSSEVKKGTAKTEEKPAVVQEATKIAEDTSKKEQRKSTFELLEAEFAKKPTDVNLKLNLVEAYLEANETRKAASLMKKFKGKETSLPRYTEVYAQLNYLTSNFKTNAKVLGEHRSLSEKAAYFLGLSFYELKDYEKAAEVLKKVSRESYPSLLNLDLQLDKHLEESQKKKAAAIEKAKSDAILNRLKQGSASEAEYLAGLMNLIEHDDWREARRLNKKAQNKFPTNPDFIYISGRIDLESKDYDKAFQEFSRLIQSGYKNNEIFYYAGLCAYRSGRMEVSGYLFDMAERNQTKRMAEIVALRASEAKGLVQKANREFLNAAIQEAETRWKTVESYGNGLPLLRLYAVKGEVALVNQMVRKLNVLDLAIEERNMVNGWSLVMQGKPAYVNALLSEDLSDEALFLLGFALLNQEQADHAKLKFAAIRNRKTFTGLEKYFE